MALDQKLAFWGKQGLFVTLKDFYPEVSFSGGIGPNPKPFETMGHYFDLGAWVAREPWSDASYPLDAAREGIISDDIGGLSGRADRSSVAI